MKPIIITFGMFLIIIGFLVLTIGMILPDKNRVQDDENSKNNDIQFSGVVMIGPIPIVVGNSPSVAILSVLMLIAVLLWMLIFYRYIVLK
ncbi:MAG: hypothetical protein PWP15_1244 [Methanothermococcus sp.]|jgi:uncharacterized protein (TIGR00304 family)|uniref:TIGR00304 family membrane protein n=1 Tax=Methanothermococcus TaxID=155862 RepID=UPI00036B65CE|nr:MULTISPECIES: TIGR00304 family protein [Methanothermococcus]MDK2790737.1 hypothetical protein [Methanothermococcus sp.]MDK2987866.1 hypothetical protein [Methanothermococcus sp.]